MKKIMLLVMLLSLAVMSWSLSVYDIQFTEDASGNSAYMDQVVTVTGIVSAVNWYSGSSDTHFCMSDAAGGEWSGVYAYNFDFEVELGDEIEVTATVQEYYGLTELSSLTDVVILSSGNPLPEPLEVTTANLAITEAYESVLVRVNGIEVTQDPDDHVQAYITDGSGECQTDDAMYDYSPEIGLEFDYMIGIVDYSYDEYGLNPRTAADIGFAGEPGYIEGMVELDGGAGNVEEVIITAGGLEVNPDDGGEYEIEIAPGTYDIIASLEGYSSQTIANVLVEEDETTSEVNFMLSPAQEVTIYDIQFTEDVSGDSPLDGQTVLVSGIVTGFGFSESNYFFMSSPEGGAWNGIYVYQFDAVLAEGDDVTFTATVSEYFGFTELGDVADLVINSSGNEVPDAEEITTAELASSEAYESVLVKVMDAEVMTLPDPETYNEWSVDDGSGECQVDDGFGAIYPGMEIGDVFDSIIGIVDYSYDLYGLHPRDISDFESSQGPIEATIYEIQFTEDASGDSPLAGQVVSVQGLVSASGYNTDYYFLTSADGGAWNGVYVYDTENLPVAGDEIQITCEVAEYFGFTELADISSYELISSGNELPEATLVTTYDATQTEAYESVMVRVEDVTVTQAQNPDFGHWYVDDGSGEMQVDDGFFYLDEVDPQIVIELDMEIVSITGILDYSYNEYGLNPVMPEDIEFGTNNDNNVIAADLNIQAWPNPYYVGNTRAAMNISFDLENAGEVSLNVYNLKGQKINEIANGYLDGGNHNISWNGNDASGKQVPSGVYFYNLKTEGTNGSGKLLLFR